MAIKKIPILLRDMFLSRSNGEKVSSRDLNHGFPVLVFEGKELKGRIPQDFSNHKTKYNKTCPHENAAETYQGNGNESHNRMFQRIKYYESWYQYPQKSQSTINKSFCFQRNG